MRQKIAWAGLVLSLITLFWVNSPFFSARAQSSPPAKTWFDWSKEPELQKTDLSLLMADFGTLIKQGYKPDCAQGLKLKRNFTAGMAIWMQTVNGCWESTGLGLIAHSGEWVVGNRSNIAGQITNRSGSYIRSTPRKNIYLETKTSYSENYVQFLIDPKLDTSHGLFGTVSHTLDRRDIFRLKTETGHNAYITAGWGMNYSKNGKWAVAHAGNGAMIRINLEAKQILNFGDPVDMGRGWNPLMAISITNDGRYAVASVTNVGSQWMRVYDLEDCQDTEHEYVATQHADCSYRDLTGFLKDNIPDFNRFSMAEFAGNDNLVFYHFSATEPKTATRYVIEAPNATPGPNKYIALGDSFASGEGVGAYFKGTDEGEDRNGCHLSRYSYPYLIGMALYLPEYHSVACSGAMEKNIIGPEKLDLTLRKSDRTNQYIKDVSGNELGYWLPGWKLQKEFVSTDDPDVITVSAIGNDIGFSDKIKRCLMPDTCYDTYEDRLDILNEVYGKFDELENMYTQIKSSANPYAKIYVIGYPKIGNSDGDCKVNVVLNNEEIKFANLLAERLNFTIRQAAARAGVKYIDVEDIFSGRGLCDSTYTPAMNGLTAGNDIGPGFLSVIGKESYHPTGFGHQLFAEAIISQTNFFTEPMPGPDDSIQRPDQTEGLEFLNKPHYNRLAQSLHFVSGLTDDIIFRNSPIRIRLDSGGYVLDPTFNIEVELHSEPREIGYIKANEDGSLDEELELPGDLPTGFHTLHLFARDVFGNEMDLYKVVYVAHTPSDKNGNGIDDIHEPCGVFGASGQDEDGDKIDDRCDPVITEPGTAEGAQYEQSDGHESLSSKDVDSWISSVRKELFGGQRPYVGNPSVAGSEITAAIPSRQGKIEEKLNKWPLAPIFIGFGVVMTTVTLIYHLRYAKE